LIADSPAVWADFARRSLAERARMRRLRTLAAVRGTDAPPRRPIFIIGCPRSGTSLVFGLLREHPDVRSLGTEGHVLWSAYQHPRLKRWSSDRSTEKDVADGEPRYLYTGIKEVSGSVRFLDKTPKNVLRIPYLHRLFPDASFVFVKRDGRATVNSLIEGWSVRSGVSYLLPERLRLKEYRGRLWSYILPPGWRETSEMSLAEVAALQYVSSNETALTDRSVIPPEAVIGVRFEQLLAHPIDETARILERLALTPSDSVMSMARELGKHPVGAISPPRAGKWETRADEIEDVLPRIEPVMARLGYGSTATE